MQFLDGNTQTLLMELQTAVCKPSTLTPTLQSREQYRDELYRLTREKQQRAMGTDTKTLGIL